MLNGESKRRDGSPPGALANIIGPRTKMIAATALKSFAFRTGLHRMLFYRYDYMFRPCELSLLVSCLTQTHGLTGPILEIGCAAGHSTVFLNKHLDDLADSRRYICIDTFAGFTHDDIAVEVDRGKETSDYAHLFRAYRKEWFDKTMSNNHVTRVTSIQADVNSFDFNSLDQISFCLIDVDLLRPVQRSLEEVLPRMAPGAIIAVDDCIPNLKFDGALAGYLEFVKCHGFPIDIRHDKVGLIEIDGK
jgi:predicted O-methyltransferase YrrM